MKLFVVRSRSLLAALLFITMQIFGVISLVLPSKAFAAGTVTTNPATNITDKTATLNGTIQGSTNANGRGFEYGTTESFGSKTADPYTFDSQIGVAPNVGGRLEEPSAVTTDSSGNIYVADTNNNLIQKFDSNGNYISKFGSSGSGVGQFSSPQGITTDSSGNIYVADTNNNRIQKFDSNGNYLHNVGANMVAGEYELVIFTSNSWSTGGTWSIDISAPLNVTVGPFPYNVSTSTVATALEAVVGKAVLSSNSSNIENLFEAIFTWETLNEEWVISLNLDNIEQNNGPGLYDAQIIPYSNTLNTTTGAGNGQFYSPRGLATDSSGNLYVADTNNSRIQKFNADGTYLAQWGGPGDSNGQFNFPQGVTTDSSGNVYVTDTNNNRIQKFDSSGNYLSKFGSSGSGNAQFNSPRGLATDTSGNIYVADTDNNRTQKFNSAGAYQSQSGTEGSANGQFNNPSDVATDSSGNLYVADKENNRIQKFDSDNIYVAQFGNYELGNSQFNNPSDVATDSSGNLYVADKENNRIQKFDSTGTFVTKWGSYGTGNGEFASPVGISIDSSENIYVASDSRIQKFDSSGTYISKFGSSGSGDGEFTSINAVEVGSDGSIYVADSSRIQKFDSTGTFVTKWGSYGTGDGEFTTPYGIAVDGSSKVYIADNDNDRIQIFDSNGNYLTQWNDFSNPYGVAVDMNDNVYVANASGGLIQKFDSSGNKLAQWSSFANGENSYSPRRITLDSSNNLYVADNNNYLVKKYTPALITNNPYSFNLGALDCDTTYFYRAYILEDDTTIYGSTQSFTTDSFCTGPDLKLSVALDEPGLIEGQTGSYTLTYKNVGTGPMLPFTQTFFSLPPNVQIEGDINNIPGVIDGGYDEDYNYGYFFVADPDRWDGESDPFSAAPLNPDESYSVTIPIIVTGPVDNTSTMKAVVFDYFAIFIFLGEPEAEGLPYEAESLELITAYADVESDPTPENINAFFNIVSNNVASYSGTIPGSSDSEESGLNSDSDPIPDAIEDAAPGNGDGNNDGTPDSEQSNVTSLPIPTGFNAGTYVTLVVPEGSTLTTTAIDQATALATKDSAYDYPLGLMSFTVSSITPGSTIPIELYYYTNQQANNFTPRKYNTTNQTYTTLSTQTQTSLTQTTINNQPVLKLSYQLQDGGPLDQDNTVNGTIVDPVGLAQASVGVPETGL